MRVQTLHSRSAGHNRLIFATAIFALNLLVTTEFVIRMRLIMRLQQTKGVVLPIANEPKDREVIKTTIVLADDGSLTFDGLPIQSTEIASLIRGRGIKRVRIVAERKVRYERLKEILKICGSAGAGVVFSVSDDVKNLPSSKNGPQ